MRIEIETTTTVGAVSKSKRISIESMIPCPREIQATRLEAISLFVNAGLMQKRAIHLVDQMFKRQTREIMRGN